tara:strand:+ start:49 stop:2289 length:2241 start_codon:yes stop_codon:yes gene_type:complete
MAKFLLKIIGYTLFLFHHLIGQSGMVIMSPDPGSTVSGKDLLIAVSLIATSNLDPNKISLFLDGEDITDNIYVDSDILSCLIDNIESGNHELKLVIDENIESLNWKFSTSTDDSELNYKGRIRTSSSFDRIDNQNLNINKVTLDFKGTAYEWLKFRTNLKLTSQENILDQPRNVYGFRLDVKEYLMLKIGDVNPRFSYFTVNGKRIRGINSNLNLGWLNFQFTKGELNRAVQGSLSNAYSFNVETNDYGEQYLALLRSNYTFKQDVFASRFSLGSGENFQLGFSFLKAKDDIKSIQDSLPKAEILYAPNTKFGSISDLDSGVVYMISELGTRAVILDGSDWSGQSPKDNIVIGTDMGVNLFNKRVRLDGEVAFSMMNNNIWDGPLSLGELDTLLDDSVDFKLLSFDLSDIPDPSEFEKLLIINPNLTPLVPIDINVFNEDPIDAIFSMPSLAYRGRAITNFFGNYIALEYNQTGPQFNSLANPYLVKNKREWSVADKLKLFQNRLMINIGYKYQDDNILTTVKNVKSQNAYSFGLNFLPGPNLPIVNFTYRTIERDNGISQVLYLTDSTFTDNRENNQTNNIMVNLNYNFDYLWNHSLSTTYVYVEKKDNYKDRNSDFIDPGMLTSVFNFSLSTTYNSPLKTNITVTSNSTELSIGPGIRGLQNFFTSTFDAKYPLLKNKILLNGGLNIASGSGTVNVSWLGLKLGLRYNLIDNLNLNAQGEFRSKETNSQSNNTIIARVNLDYSF